MSTDPTKMSYNKIAEEFAVRNREPFWVEEYDTFSKMLSIGSSILDIGCGTGRDAKVFSDMGFVVTGIDYSSEMLRLARQNVPDAVFKEMDFRQIDFPEKSFDAFWAAASLLHLPKNEFIQTLRHISSKIKTGGRGFVSLKQKDKTEDGIIHEEKMGGIDRYFSFYTQDEMIKHINSAGLRIILSGVKIENDNRKTHWLYAFVEIL